VLISLIAAVAQQNVIGKNNRLVWRMPADMLFFKQKTTGHCVVTGRKNYESIPEKFRPLPDRTNIVVTRQANYQAPGAVVLSSIEKAMEWARAKNETELFIIGGAEIYTQTLAIADKLYITHINHFFEGDAFFPAISADLWKKISEKQCAPDEKNPHPYAFCEYVKR
jgi:dihydrofolate reductase